MSGKYPLNNALALPTSSKRSKNKSGDSDGDGSSNTGSGTWDESTLIETAKANPKAFGDIYERYVGRVYRYMHARAESDEDAEDLTQQVFLQALDALPRYRERGLPFAAWLFRISRNLANDSFRRKRATIPWQSVPHQLHPVDPTDYEHEALRRQDLDWIKPLIGQLHPEQRELIALRFLAGLTLSEIAKVVNRSQGTVQRQMVQVLQTLKERYKEQGEGQHNEE